MYSYSKTQISIDIARQIVCQIFGNGSTINERHELTDGMFNAAYFLELADGLKCVLKVAPPDSVKVLRYEKNIMQAEVEVMRLVKERIDMPVPEIYAYNTSRNLLDNDYYLMAFIPGIPLNKMRPTLPPEVQQAIDYQTGVYLRQMNEIEGASFGYYAQEDGRSHSWKESFDRMLINVLQDGKDMQVDLPLPYEEVYDQVRQFYPALEEVTSPCLVHWDLWDGNIFVDPATRQITGMIDFERALWADPLMEVNFGVFGINPSFMRGYGREMLGTPAKEIRRIFYNIYLFLIMVIECYYRRYETKDQENWARGLLMKEMDKLKIRL
jgi:aminoglycoside phosphotransferase (APT) family kinase protein